MISKTTIATAIDALEEEYVRVKGQQEWWQEISNRHKRYQAELDAIDAALAELRALSQPLDAPDSPGWWAFEGKWNSEKVTGTFRDIAEVQLFQGELQVALGGDWEPVTRWIGKWYRLTMPWEVQP
jgi:hypothetical protein